MFNVMTMHECWMLSFLTISYWCSRASVIQALVRHLMNSRLAPSWMQIGSMLASWWVQVGSRCNPGWTAGCSCRWQQCWSQARHQVRSTLASVPISHMRKTICLHDVASETVYCIAFSSISLAQRWGVKAKLLHIAKRTMQASTLRLENWKGSAKCLM